MTQLDQVAKLIETSPESIAEVLTHRHVATRGEAIKTPINQAKAVYARDALAKVFISHLFIRNFIIARSNLVNTWYLLLKMLVCKN